MINLGIPTAVRSEQSILYDFYEKSKDSEIYQNINSHIFQIPTYFPLAYYEAINWINDLELDAMFIFGDRPEMLAVCQACAEKNVAIIHHHGGDVTDSGYIDEKVRHSISKYANIHFPASKEAKELLIKMGENYRYVINSGSIALDSCHDIKPVISKHNPIILYNPYNIEELKSFKAFLIKSKYKNPIAIEPNGDRYSNLLYIFYKELNIECIKTIPRKEFLGLLKCEQNTFIGNSSAFYIERSFWKKGSKIIHFGMRNKDRLTGTGVYGTGNASKIILTCINELDIDIKEHNKIKKLNY